MNSLVDITLASLPTDIIRMIVHMEQAETVDCMKLVSKAILSLLFYPIFLQGIVNRFRYRLTGTWLRLSSSVTEINYLLSTVLAFTNVMIFQSRT